MQKLIIGLLVFIILLVGIQFLTKEVPVPLGGAPGGGQAINATSSLISLLPTEDRNLFASSTCVARMITSTATPIIIKIGDHNNWILTNLRGH